MDISINESLNWKDLTAIYAAVVATGIALINYLKYRRDIRNKLAVTLFLQGRMHDLGNGYLGAPFHVLVLKVVNHSAATKYLTQPTLETGKSSEKFTVINVVNPISYPARLESGQVWENAFDVEPILERLHKYKANRVRVVITDTLGKSFKSKWTKVRDIQPPPQ